MLKRLENPIWDDRTDTRHIEDCMMYYGIANRVAGTGEDLDRVRRVFDWAMKQVQLVPAGTLGAGRLGQAIARPYDVLLRGMATESEGRLGRAGLAVHGALPPARYRRRASLTYTKGNSVEPIALQGGGDPRRRHDRTVAAQGPKPPVIWICAALIDDHAYLFDARLGLEIPGPGGHGVATLAEALADPSILERMDLPGQAPYFTSRASLLASPTKIGVLIDSSPGYFSPKMRLLQRELSGKHRTILYRDPAEQRDHFARVLAPHDGAVALWELPLEVETRLFTDAAVRPVDPEFALLLPARIPPALRPDQAAPRRARRSHRGLRAGSASQDNLPDVTDKEKKRMITKDVQDGLDVYATYYLGLAHLERNNLDLAELMFRMTLDMLPEPGPNQPYYNMFRWGANANLGRIARGRRRIRRGAVGYYTQSDPTFQYVGNLIRARELVWDDPMSAAPDPLPARTERR